MIKRVIYSISVILIISAITAGIIAYARGYSINFGKKTLNPNGILSISSYPDKASVFIDGKLSSATNASIFLPPGWYQVRISKEGYQSWEKKIRIQGEVVSQIDALLIPNNPSLRSLTLTGVYRPALSPSSTKIAYIVPEEAATTSASLKSKTGIWIFDLKDGTLGGKNIPKNIFQPASKYDWENTRFFWSPDEKDLIAAFMKKEKNKESLITALQFSLNGDSDIPTNVTSIFSDILAKWQTLAKEKQDLQIEPLPKTLVDLLTKAADKISFSPDETKIFYLATNSATLVPVITPPLIGSNSTLEVRSVKNGGFYIYDLKEDKNYFVVDQKEITGPESPVWYSDSKHILMIEKDTIYIINYDGTNKRAVYAGPFVGNVLYNWPAGGKILILANFSKPKDLPNLYEIDLR